MNHEYWYLSRAAGFAAYGLLFSSVALGLLTRTRLLERALRRNRTFDLHRFVSLLAVVFTLFHVYILLGDGFFSFSVWQLSFPFISPYRMWAMTAGVAATYLLVIVVASFYVRQFIGYRAWRAIHFATFALFALAAAHGITSGTDTGEAWAKTTYVATIVVVMALLFYRLQHRLPATAGFRAVRAGSGFAAAAAAALILLATGLFSARPFSASAGGGAGETAAISYMPSFADNLSATYKQTTAPSGSQLAIEGDADGDITFRIEIELDQSASTVTTNDVRLLAPGSGELVCEGKLTTLRGNDMALACEGTGPLAGVRVSASSRFSASRNGTVTGSLNGTMERTA